VSFLYEGRIYEILEKSRVVLYDHIAGYRKLYSTDIDGADIYACAGCYEFTDV